MKFYSGLTSFHDFPSDIGVETVAQCHFPLDIALDCRERLKSFRDVVTFFRLDLLHDLATIEGSKFLFVGHGQDLAFPPIEEQIVEFIHVHLYGYIDKCVVICDERVNNALRVHSLERSFLHEAEKHLSLVKQPLRRVPIGNVRAEDK